jgi:hypothetical protein
MSLTISQNANLCKLFCKIFVYLLQNDLHIFSNNLLSPEFTITFAARNFHKFCQILLQKPSQNSRNKIKNVCNNSVADPDPGSGIWDPIPF